MSDAERTLRPPPHHDGSEVCVRDVPDELGGDAVVRLRVPHGPGVDAVALRNVPDGETRVAARRWTRRRRPRPGGARHCRSGTRRRVPLARARRVRARLGERAGRRPARRRRRRRLRPRVDRGGPDWHLTPSSTRSSPTGSPRASSTPSRPTGRAARVGRVAHRTGPDTAREWFGGDLAGIERRLDHVESLGASVLYLTPSSRPDHAPVRRDVVRRIDPLLGGDTALSSLVERPTVAASASSVTSRSTTRAPTTTGSRAPRDGGARRAGVLLLRRGGSRRLRVVGGRTDPAEVRLALEELRAAHGGPAPSRGAGCEPPFDLDGWRIDVANMAGRHGDVDVAREVARPRAPHVEARPDARPDRRARHDARADLQGGGWHGTMNYTGFTRPAWCWLRGDELPGAPAWRSSASPSVCLVSAGVGGRDDAPFRAGVPWRPSLHSWAFLDSHDTARFRTVTGSRDRHAGRARACR